MERRVPCDASIVHKHVNRAKFGFDLCDAVCACVEIANIESQVQPRSGETPYMRIGDWPLWWASAAVTLLSLLGGVLLTRRRSKAGASR